ncbi:MAG TPA: histidine phosphatase family protein [Gaiellales bacterium]|jgi:broad specificity phosphatase PhoE|nr:histidine phosphatase family protein [Gaiellales bacterium]
MHDDTSPAPAARRQACRIYLVRHGQTIMNAQVRFRGRLDIPLNEVGRAEAQEAARALVGSGLVAVYTSPLGRAREVAEAIAVKNGVGGVRAQPDLINLDYGAWEGLTKEESAAVDPDAWAAYTNDPEAAVCPEGEAVRDAADRVVAALRAIGRDHAGESVAAVSHGVMLRLAVLRVAGASSADWQFAMPTGKAIVFEVEDGEIALVSDVDRSKSDPVKAARVQVALTERAV